MTYQAPYIDDSGLHTNSYEDILDYFISGAKNIFGQDIYLGNDSQDYQMLSILSKAIYDGEQCAQVNYQSRSPLTTTNADAIDGLVTLNGLVRKSASYSTVSLVLTGLPYTQITNGVVQSDGGNRFDLPTNVTLGSTGTVTVVATAEDEGAIEALANTITTIVTPTYGWYTVNNPSPANVGQPVETTQELIQRQQASVALPSKTPKEGIEAGIYSVEGITDFKVYENDTGTDEPYDTSKNFGGPEHSITCIVEGGNDNDIAKQIDLRKTLGCYTTGDIEIPVYDNMGSENKIRFYRPSYTDVYVNINLTPLTGYSTAVADEIKNSVKSYLDKFTIGNNLYVSQIWEATLLISPDLRPYFSLESVTLGLSSESLSTNNLIAGFREKFQTSVENITITLSS